MLCDAELMQMHKRGLFPAPGEADAAFERRVQLFPGGKSAVTVFDLAADWLEIEYSNRDLSFLEGGATWVGEHPKIQLRTPFKTRKKWFGYTKDELLKHETVHAMRSLFEEPRFEEMLAYSTSPRSWRRFFGPLFQSPRTGYLLIVTSLLPLIHPILWLAPAAIFVKLTYNHFLYRKACKHLSPSTLICMRDHEIAAVGRGERLQLGNSPRERLLKVLLKREDSTCVI